MRIFRGANLNYKKPYFLCQSNYCENEITSKSYEVSLQRNVALIIMLLVSSKKQTSAFYKKFVVLERNYLASRSSEAYLLKIKRHFIYNRKRA